MVFSKPNRERQKLMREQNILKQVGEAGRAGPGRAGSVSAGRALPSDASRGAAFHKPDFVPQSGFLSLQR